MLKQFANLVGAQEAVIEPEVEVFCDYGCTKPGDSYHIAEWRCSTTSCWIYSCVC